MRLDRSAIGIVTAVMPSLGYKRATEVAKIAHSIKGAAANLSAEPLRATAGRLEANARQGNLGDPGIDQEPTR